MGLDKFYYSWMFVINLRMNQCFLEGRDVKSHLFSILLIFQSEGVSYSVSIVR